MVTPTVFTDQHMDRLRAFHASGATRPATFRRKALQALDRSLRAEENALLTAMHADMGKPVFEAYMSDVGLVYKELNHALEHLDAWMRPTAVPTPTALQPASSKVHKEPLGVVLIIAPWNYPALLLLSPLIGAIAAGNCAVVKPSNEAPRTAAVLERIVRNAFAEEHVTLVQGPGRSIGPALIERHRFDHIFFTGSAAVGAQVMAMAARHLTPVTLELGGKSPAIVDRRVDLRVAAGRVAWSKFFNAGQTCIATDHAFVHADVLEPFLQELQRSVQRFYGSDPRQSPHFARLVNTRRFNTVKGYLGEGHIHIGGEHDAGERYVAPTVMTEIPPDAALMREEIFGPVLPVIPWREREEVLAFVRRNPHPLAAYIHSKDRSAQQWFTERISFGGGCINHAMLQFGNPALPFGGVGTSGMGRYHGRHTFDLFSHHKGVVKAPTWIEHGLQLPPYTPLKERLLRWLLR